MSEESITLYEKIGGDEAISSLVYAFYRRIFADPELAPFFERIEQDRLRSMQQEFFSAALDGPTRYTGRPLHEVHAGLGIQLRHLSRFLDHMMEVLADFPIGERDQYEIRSRINTYADEITGATPQGD